MTRWIGRVALSLATLALLAALRWTTPGYAVITGPIPVTGHDGEARARAFTISLGAARIAKRVHFSRFGRSVSRDTSGLWIVVPATIAATRISTFVSSAAWEGPDRRRFSESRRVGDARAILTGKRLQPGLPVHGIFVFEVAADAVADGRLIASTSLAPQLDSEARIVPTSLDAGRPLDEVDLDGADLR